jgi:hypoxanthine-guanine phosphoribosyltransferase
MRPRIFQQSKTVTDTINQVSAPYIPFPAHAVEDELAGQNFFWYIRPEVMQQHIQTMTETIKLNSYDHVFYVRQSGLFLYEHFSAVQKYPRSHENLSIEYHAHPGREVSVIKPVPEGLRGSVLVIDDVWNTGTTGSLIARDIRQCSEVTNITIVVVAYKRDISQRILVPGITLEAVVQVDNRWLGGCGMDLGTDPAIQHHFRQLGGLVVKKE